MHMQKKSWHSQAKIDVPISRVNGELEEAKIPKDAEAAAAAANAAV